jgi:hypothetical protein
MPISRLLSAWHRDRVRRVFANDKFIGAHGVSFLTVI